MKLVLEQTKLAFEEDDGGQALIAEFVADDGAETGLFVRLQSWDPSKRHPDFRALVGKRVRITVETLPC